MNKLYRKTAADLFRLRQYQGVYEEKFS